MANQLSLFAPPSVPVYLPHFVHEILRACQSIGARIVRGHWGVGLHGRKWVLVGDSCCPLSALLIAKKAAAESGDNSAAPSVSRLLGITDQEVYEFNRGFDGHGPGNGSKWFEYGQLVALELGFK